MSNKTHPFKKINMKKDKNIVNFLVHVEGNERCPICNRDVLWDGVCYTCGYGIGDVSCDFDYNNDIINDEINIDDELLDIDFFSM